MQPRTRLVTFRLSDEEYEHLRAVSAARGARSVSEFVRSSVGWIIENCDRQLWEFLITWGKASFHPITNSRRMQTSRAGHEQTMTPCDQGLDRRDAPADTLLALETLKDKIEALSRLIRNLSADAREANSFRTRGGG